MGDKAGMEQSEHTKYQLSLLVLGGHGPWCPITITIVTSKITDPHKNHNNNLKNYSTRVTKM